MTQIPTGGFEWRSGGAVGIIGVRVGGIAAGRTGTLGGEFLASSSEVVFFMADHGGWCVLLLFVLCVTMEVIEELRKIIEEGES